MQFATVRSGVAESFHDVDVLVVDREGSTILSSGDTDRPLYYRSAVKPFQALAAARGGLTLPDEHLAVTCASHGGFPVHLAIVGQILSDHGLTSRNLKCTPDRPLNGAADAVQRTLGNTRKEPRFHNCSGKHAGWLAACSVAGWDPKSYLSPDHPLQQSIFEIMHEVSGINPTPTGIDGCGAPTMLGTLRGLANAFTRLGTDEELAPIATAMSRFSALTADNTRPDGRSGLWWGGAQKVGAEGLFGMTRSGITIATKSRSGSSIFAVAAALAAAEQIGALSEAMVNGLKDQLAPPVLGAGESVGVAERVSR